MKKLIDDKLEEIRRAATTQTNQVCNELNALASALQDADNRLLAAMAAATRKQEEAAQIEALAQRDHSTALHAIIESTLALVQQLDDGQMVTGSTETPATRKSKPKLIGNEKEEAA